MRAVWSWLRELAELPADVSAEQAAAALTGVGLEVESFEEVGADFSGVLVAEVVATRAHPGADKLTLVDVITAEGGAATEVVCGASNVPEPGGRVLWARPGARLPGGVEISPREIKGVLSAGMLCSEDEIGLGDDHDGIIVLGASERGAALGSDPATSLGLRDAVFDISVPANRPDVLGHLGLARELVAVVGGRIAAPRDRLGEFEDESVRAADRARVVVEEPLFCPRYTAMIIDGLTVGPSPRWLRRRLAMVGVRPLKNLVDVTNYVMFELGQPLHAFDYAAIKNQTIVVRRAADGEKMTTLDGATHSLLGTDLLICDGGGPIALAGVMGGADSEVSEATTSVLLEAAHFAPKCVRATSRRLDLRSESSYRFERHVDPSGVADASRRAATLLAELGGGRVARGLVDVYPTPAATRTVEIRPSRASALIGVEISAAETASRLASLGLEVSEEAPDCIAVVIPTARPDLTREVDLIEEVLRLRGFESVPATLPPLTQPPRPPPRSVAKRAREALLGAGLSEAITFGFTSPESISALRFTETDPRSRPIALRNPMSLSQSVMRTSLLSTLLGAVSHNIRNQERDVALFEIGSVFIGEVSGAELPAEPKHVAAVIAGRRPGHLGDRGLVDLFDLKGVVDRLLAAIDPFGDLGITAASSRSIGHLHPGLAAELSLPSGSVVGGFGEIHPEVRAAFAIEVPVFGFELDLSQIPCGTAAQMRPIPKYPAITRDLSFFVAAEISARNVGEKLRGGAPESLEDAELLEDFRDPAYVPAGQKGMLWSLTYRSYERTLTDAEVDEVHEALCQSVLADLSASRR